MLDGLPELGQYVTNLVLRTGPRDALAIVVFHHMGDLLNAVRHAVGHYLPLTLDEPYLQNSSIGSPYQKWAKFTNEDFAPVDECLRRLLVAAHSYYQRAYHPLLTRLRGNNKDASHWFGTVARQYVCCRIGPDQPLLTTSSIHMAGWVGVDEPAFLKVRTINLPRGEMNEQPAIVTTQTRSIADRAALRALFPAARANRDGLAAAHDRLAAGLRAACAIEDVTAPHKGSLSDIWIGVSTIAGLPPK